ncbi:DNA topoisomerase 1-like isoform X2 [Cornus florida]|uniref:DNA topoisomerase 1-like isoform X2 n=1 Tax=Cornus florida TaxID=4283 RepID=UPI00289CBBD2|nr:DNA topoisomerase 1-like isoform X2 [Cornus florida]
MAVQACVKPKMVDDYDEEDDEPLVFRRTSKQNKLSSETKKSSSQKSDGQSGRQVPGVVSPNGRSLSAQKGKTVSSARTSPAKSPIVSPNASTSSAKASVGNSPVANSKASMTDDQSKHSSKQNTSTVVKEEKQLIKPAARSHDDSEDSEDDKPLSTRLTVGSSKVNSNNRNRGPGNSGLVSPPSQKPGVSKYSEDDKPIGARSTVGSSKGNSNHRNSGPGNSGLVSPPSQKPGVNKYSDDSDDEVLLSSKFQLKSNAGASTSNFYDSDEDKPLASKLQQNGSITRDNQPRKPSTVVNKRPLSEIKSSSQSSVKKTKLSYVSTSISSKQASVKVELKAEVDDDDIPISQRIKKAAASGNKSSSARQKETKVATSIKKKIKKPNKVMKNSKYSKSSKLPPSSGEGQKWITLVHNGVIFPPPYKPHGVKMLYKGKPVDLTPEQEEVATMFAVMLDTDYMNKPKFKENFMTDWRKILGKNHVIQKLDDCNFTPIYEWHQKEKEKKKQMTTDEKKALKEDKLKQEEKYMWAIVDGVKEKVGNFRVEPPGLFRGRGEHPKMGKLKRRIRPSDITINIGKNAPIPECPIPGESWKEIRHDNTVTWLAFWNDPINPKEFKYVFLAASSSLKGQSDKEKYEKARMLKDYIGGIRAAYTKDFASKDITKRQIAVATYLIDKLALRAGNEKDDDEADTVGCCTLKVENVEPSPPNILKFDFLGKDSIRYQNEVEVELPVFKAIQQFRTGKKGGDDLFDKLDTSKLNAHLKELMPGLTAKVFRTYNASITLDEMVSSETNGGDVAEKVVLYQHANKEVAIICNHQRSVSKSHSAQMTRLNEKIDELKGILDELQTDLARAKKGKPPLKNADGKPKKNLTPEALERKIAQNNTKIEKMERDKETKENLKTVALGTSKINYLDPRITVAWCKRHEVPIEKIFNKSLLAKFAWAMDIEPEFRF